MLAVDAALIAESAGLRLRIDGSGSLLTCRLDSGASALTALGQVRRALPLLRSVTPILLAAGLRLDVVAGRVRVARFGSGVTQNALGRLLRLPHAHLGR